MGGAIYDDLVVGLADAVTLAVSVIHVFCWLVVCFLGWSNVRHLLGLFACFACFFVGVYFYFTFVA